MRLVIAGPTREIVPAQFAVDLAQLYAKTLASDRWSSVVLGFVGATYVHVGREEVLDVALRKLRATHLLWLDTDMAFPPETAIRLAMHEQPIVAANCLMRDPRRLWTARRDNRRIETKPHSTGLEAVDTVGLAVMLMQTDAVAGLMKPWFRHGWNAEQRCDIGEDVMFCQRLRDAGQTIYIDHDLSKEIGHIGQYTFRPTPIDHAAFAV